MERFIFNLKIALGALLHNKVRSLLTALGIIFGVASVIAMQAVGKGTQQDLLDQLRLVGVNNIMINQKAIDKSVKKQPENGKASINGNSSFGLSLADAQALKNIIPGVDNFSCETELKAFTVYDGKGYDAKLIGVTSSYFSILSRTFESGRNFDSAQVSNVAAVCILSSEAKQKFFHGEHAIGQYIRSANRWLQVVGVLASLDTNDSLKKKSATTDNQVDIYTPINTLLIRFGDRSFITRNKLNNGNNNDDDDDVIIINQGQNTAAYNQVDRIILQVKDSKNMRVIADAAGTILKRRHSGISDFEIKIPEAELKQKQHTKDIFNLVLGIIAGISLLVGGIGIMNIMLVSVTERTREIGLRMALGARKPDIVQQFLAEAIMISSGGGLIGVGLGIVISKLISGYFDIPTIFTFISLIIAFTFSVIVGLIFGIAPAKRAAKQNPIESLRYE